MAQIAQRQPIALIIRLDDGTEYELKDAMITSYELSVDRGPYGVGAVGIEFQFGGIATDLSYRYEGGIAEGDLALPRLQQALGNGTRNVRQIAGGFTPEPPEVPFD